MAICNLKNKRVNHWKFVFHLYARDTFHLLQEIRKHKRTNVGKHLGDSLNHDKNTRQVIIKIYKISTCRCGDKI